MRHDLLDQLKREQADLGVKIDQLNCLLQRVAQQQQRPQAEQAEMLFSLLKSQKQLIDNSERQIALLQQQIGRIPPPTFQYWDDELHQKVVECIVSGLSAKEMCAAIDCKSVKELVAYARGFQEHCEVVFQSSTQIEADSAADDCQASASTDLASIPAIQDRYQRGVQRRLVFLFRNLTANLSSRDTANGLVAQMCAQNNLVVAKSDLDGAFFQARQEKLKK